MQINKLAGQLLLATPSLQDPNFKDSVILICHHDDEGCMGLIINRPQDIPLSDILIDLGIQDTEHHSDPNSDIQRVFEGGPVDDFRGFVLHDSWQTYDSTMEITPELHLTASRDVLEDLALGEGPEHFMLILGYAGWQTGQLESELSNNDWLIAPSSQRIVFQEPPEQRWDFGARCMGFKRSQLSDQVGHA